MSAFGVGKFRSRLVAILALVCAGVCGTALGQPYVFSEKFGSGGTGDGQFSDLNFIAVDPFNRDIIVGDAGNNRVQIFRADGNYLSQFGSAGNGNGQFNGVGGIAVDPSSHEIFVADGNGRIEVFSASGAYERQFGAPGSAAGQLAAPVAIAIDATSHNVVVAELGNNRVDIFTSSGSFVAFVGSGTGQFEYPCYMNIDPITHNIIVSDEETGAVSVFDKNGAYLTQFGSFGSGNGQFGFPAPGAIAIDTVTHHILVQDYGNDRIQIFDASGNYVDQFGSGGDGDGQFHASDGPTGMEIDHQSGNVVVEDRGNNRVEVFTPSVSSGTDCGPTTVDLSIEPLTASLSQSIFFSGTASIQQPLGGTISFVVDGNSVACVASLGDVQGACVHPLGLGTHSVVARYSGNGFNQPGCSVAQSVTVVPDTTQTPTTGLIGYLPQEPAQGDPITLTYSVSQMPTNNSQKKIAANLDGYVTFTYGATVLGYAALVNDAASLTTTMPGGSFALSATYSGNSTYASTSNTANVVVTKPSDDIFYGGLEIVH